MTLPQFRVDVQITTHEEGGQQYLVLHDSFGIAEGPIMVHADMIDILSLCDGESTWEHVALAAEVDANGPEILRVRSFIEQLEDLGYFEGERCNVLRQRAIDDWNTLPSRPPVCAGTTYPDDPDVLKSFLTDELGIDPAAETGTAPIMALIPHIDFRVAPHVYGAGFNALRSSKADLVVMIGTSHYWDADPIVVTNKSFQTPLGIVPVIDHPFFEPLADIAHKPEHSLELHVVALQHLWQGRPFEILPVLVTQAVLEPGILEETVVRLQNFISSTGRNALWLISGDLAHVGMKFGDTLPAASLLADVRGADQRLIKALEDNDLAAYRAEIESADNRFRVCGYAPSVLALSACHAGRGRAVAYDVWDEKETASAVSFATIIWD